MPEPLPIPDVLAHDALDAWEPLPVPRARLLALGVLQYAMAFSYFLPYNPRFPFVTLLGVAIRGGAGGSGLRIVYLFPLFATICGMVIVARLRWTTLILDVPRGASPFTSVIVALSVLWVGVSVRLWLHGTQALQRLPLLLFALMVACVVPPVLGVVMARLGPGRHVFACSAAAGMNLALLLWHSAVMRTLYWFAWLRPLAAAGSMAVGISIILVYRAQRQLEHAFHQAMREHDTGEEP